MMAAAHHSGSFFTVFGGNDNHRANKMASASTACEVASKPDRPRHAAFLGWATQRCPTASNSCSSLKVLTCTENNSLEQCLLGTALCQRCVDVQLSKVIKHLHAQLEHQEAVGASLEGQLATALTELERLQAVEANQQEITEQARIIILPRHVACRTRLHVA